MNCINRAGCVNHEKGGNESVLNALYMNSMNGQKLAVGNETVFMYDRRTVGRRTVCSSTAFRLNTPHVHHEPHVISAHITRPYDRAAAKLCTAKLVSYNWHHYSYIPNVFQIRYDKLIEQYAENLYIKESSFEKVARKNGQLNHPSELRPERKAVLDLFRDKGYPAVDDWYYKRLGIKRYVYEVWDMMPRKLQLAAKKVLHFG